jgi:hypothetical protein
MKLNKKMILTLGTTFATILATTQVRANALSGSTILSEGKSFTDVTDSPISISDVITNFLPLGQVLVGFATGIIVIVGMIMGVKYMLAGANEKANLKEKLIWYIISIVLIYGAVGIATIVYNIVQAIIST